jgi:hydrogenase expression/formation protein HypD
MGDQTEQKARAQELSRAMHTLAGRIGREVRLMEVCGTHTVAIFRHGVRDLLPPEVKLLSGPGCPVCVTGMRDVDMAVALASRPGVVLATFGDMMRVPGGTGSLYTAKASGADVRVVYSPLNALKLARAEPEREVVFFSTGFETTSPLAAATVVQAEEEGVRNFHLLTVNKLVPPALAALLADNAAAIDGFILPGHVCAITGVGPYEFVARDHGTACVVTGFGGMDILEGIFMTLQMIATGAPEVKVQYRMVVRPEGNPAALRVMYEAFEPADAYWRGIGTIAGSGLALREKYAHRDAARVLGAGMTVPESTEPRGCSCGSVLRGLKIPTDCPLFGKTCTPEKPVGACMVSAEGSCAAFYKYGQR